MDIWTKQKRSEVMALIPSKNTKPEIKVRSLLHRLGFRFTINSGNNRKLPGKPDILLPKYKTVIFVHGCFWHGHKGCPHFRLPKSKVEWWTAKIAKNANRDSIVEEKLRELGWNVVIIWECETKRLKDLEMLGIRLEKELRLAPTVNNGSY